MMLAQRRKTGFTMLELLVVIGIMVVLMAIMVPVGRRLRENNTTSRCQSQLAHLGRALQMYFLDEQGVPPIGVAGNLDGSGVPVPAEATIDHARWPGLQVLFYLNYTSKRDALHCPRHIYDSAGNNLTRDNPEYYLSYIGRDPAAKPDSAPLRQYKYMPYRWATEASHPNDYRRQLTRNLKQIDLGGTSYLVTSNTTAMPPDDTIITWCDYHAETHTLNGHGQYAVLYWDGSVRLMDVELFTDTTVAPAEAWMVRPQDMAH